MNIAEYYESGLKYKEFLDQYASEGDRSRWRQVYEQTKLSPEQETLLGTFAREMHVLCLAGAWCGDCAEQCPIFGVFEAATEVIHVRYVDRDAHSELKETLTICGGARVPQVVFLSEDMQHVSRYGDRTLAKYRQMAASIDGAACSTGILGATNQYAEVVQEWLNEFERIQLILRTSPRLRAKHAD